MNIMSRGRQATDAMKAPSPTPEGNHVEITA